MRLAVVLYSRERAIRLVAEARAKEPELSLTAAVPGSARGLNGPGDKVAPRACARGPPEFTLSGRRGR